MDTKYDKYVNYTACSKMISAVKKQRRGRGNGSAGMGLEFLSRLIKAFT